MYELWRNLKSVKTAFKDTKKETDSIIETRRHRKRELLLAVKKTTLARRMTLKTYKISWAVVIVGMTKNRWCYIWLALLDSAATEKKI